MRLIRSPIRSVLRSLIRSPLEDRFGGLPPLPAWVTTDNLWSTSGGVDPQNFNGAGWTRTNITVTDDSIPGPYAGSFGALLTESTDAGNATHEIVRSSTIDFTAGEIYLWRLVVKAIGRDINMFLPGTQFGGTAPQVTFALDTGTPSIVAGSPTAAMTALGDDWWLIAMQAECTTLGSNITTRALRLHNGTAVSYQGDGRAAVYVAAVGLHIV